MKLANKLKFYFLSFFAITLLSFVVFNPSFNLALQDDDWRGIVLPKTEYADGRLFNPYGIQLWFCVLLYDLFGLNFPSYYILSFALRLLLSFSIFIFLYKFTKNHFASFLGSLLVAVGFSGLQTTYEIANTNVYIALIGFVVFLGAFIFNLNKISIKGLIVIVVSLVFVTLASPVRTYPLFAWAFTVDGLGFLINCSKARLRVFLVRQSVIFLVFLLLYQLGLFSWFSLDNPSQNRIYDLSKFFTEIKFFLSNLNISIFSNYILGLGNILLPSTLSKGIVSITLGSSYIISLIGFLFLLIKRRSEKIYYFFSFFLWPFLYYSSYFIVILSGYEDVSKETVVLESYRRYLLPPFIGLSISLSILLSYLRIDKRKIILFPLVTLIIVHCLATYFFLSKLSKQRDGYFMNKIWKQFKELIPESKLATEKTNVFYFETDKSPRAIYTLDDGFILHVTTIYKIPQRSTASNPAEITAFTKLLRHTFSFNELVMFIEKGFPNDPGPISWDRVFALKIEKDKLVDIKEEVKQRVESVWKY